MEESPPETPSNYTNKMTQKTLAGKFLSLKHINLSAAKETLLRAWNIKGTCEINETESNVLVFVFSDQREANRIIKTAPWNFRGSLIILVEWEDNLAYQDLKFESEYFWVQATGIPAKFMSLETATFIGKFLYSDLAAEGLKWRKALRFRVSINIL